MNSFKINHLHVICDDLERMIKFWSSGVGATFQGYRTFGKADGAVLDLNGLQINLRVPKDTEEGIKKNTVSLGYDHLGFEVENLDSACSHLASFGCCIESGPVDLVDRRIAFLKGPEDIILELIEFS